MLSKPPCVALSHPRDQQIYGELMPRKAFTIQYSFREKFIQEADYFGASFSGRTEDKFAATKLTAWR